MNIFHEKLNNLYNGRSKRAVRFRFALLTIDIVTIAFFVASSMMTATPAIVAAEVGIGSVLLVDFLVRLWIAKKRLRYMLQLTTVADVIVIATLLAPVIAQNFAFLRVMRALRLLRSHHVLKDLRGRYRFFARNEEIIQSVINLMVFIFFVTALVYVLQVRVNPDIKNYIDALYFTVSTLTTTGFGDITLHGSVGHLLSVIIMVFGVALFLRLVQTIFHPNKVHFQCPSCGLKRHDPDAVHCKHCGVVLNIETGGD